MYYQWLYIRIGYGLFAIINILKKPASLFQASELFTVLLTLVLLLFMAASAEAMNVFNWVKMVVALDQIRMCIGLTALIKAIIVEPTKTILSQAGFFSFMLGQNFY